MIYNVREPGSFLQRKHHCCYLIPENKQKKLEILTMYMCMLILVYRELSYARNNAGMPLLL